MAFGCGTPNTMPICGPYLMVEEHQKMTPDFRIAASSFLDITRHMKQKQPMQHIRFGDEKIVDKKLAENFPH
jgi:hypothetical protein